MSVRFTSHNYRDTHEVYVRVHDAEPIERAIGKRKMAAEHVQIRYLRRDSDYWEPNVITVSGGLLKADGTAGKQIVTERFYRNQRLRWPEWLTGLVESSQPAAGATVARKPLVAA
jgi:hypothetical protein